MPQSLTSFHANFHYIWQRSFQVAEGNTSVVLLPLPSLLLFTVWYVISIYCYQTNKVFSCLWQLPWQLNGPKRIFSNFLMNLRMTDLNQDNTDSEPDSKQLDLDSRSRSDSATSTEEWISMSRSRCNPLNNLGTDTLIIIEVPIIISDSAGPSSSYHCTSRRESLQSISKTHSTIH